MIFLPFDQTFFSFSPKALRTSRHDLQGFQDLPDLLGLQDFQRLQDPRDLQGLQASRLQASRLRASRLRATHDDDGKDDMDVHKDNNADDDKRKDDNDTRKECKPFNDHLSCVDNAVYAAPSDSDACLYKMGFYPYNPAGDFTGGHWRDDSAERKRAPLQAGLLLIIICQTSQTKEADLAVDSAAMAVAAKEVLSAFEFCIAGCKSKD